MKENEDMALKEKIQYTNKLDSILAPYRATIDKHLRSFLKRQSSLDMYKQMSYFLGYMDEHLAEIEASSGKRFRSALTLLIAEYYGDSRKALSTALSIELFHNFTLIHDDIADNDEERRGRPTLWKVWGRNHAINTGDAQHALSQVVLTEDDTLLPSIFMRLQHFLNRRYIEVAEGQYLDFLLTETSMEDELVNKDTYMNMITKKAAVLVGAATAAAGIATNQSEQEEKNLYMFGLNMGIAYQLKDDFASIWSDNKKTGKKILGDIIERKKTFPILVAMQELSQSDKRELVELYSDDDNSQESAQKILNLIEKTDALGKVRAEINHYAKEAEIALTKLSLSENQKKNLLAINTVLLS